MRVGVGWISLSDTCSASANDQGNLPLRHDIRLRHWAGLVSPHSVNIRDILWVGLGGGIGSMARFGVVSLVARWLGERLGETLPFGTILVNVTGCFLIGLVAGVEDPGLGWINRPSGRQFLIAGVCGGYTTFSAFSLQTLRLIQNRSWTLAGLNVLGSIILCMAAITLGHLCAVWWTGRKAG